MTTDDSTTTTTPAADAQAEARQEAIEMAAQAARRAENGEFVFQTRAEAMAFVNALPAGVEVRWHVIIASLPSRRLLAKFLAVRQRQRQRRRTAAA